MPRRKRLLLYAPTAPTARSIAGRQYVDQLNWTTGLDPKTGRPLNYNPDGGVQIYGGWQPTATRAKPNSEKLCPSHTGGKNWEPSAYNPELGLLYIPSIEGCNFIETVEQKDFADQGGNREAARALQRRRHQDQGASLRAASKRSIRSPGTSRPPLKLFYSELRRRHGDSRRPGVPRPHRRHVFPPMTPRRCRKLWSFNTGNRHQWRRRSPIQ